MTKSKKKRINKPAVRKTAQANSNATLQIIAGVIVVAVIAIIVWLVLSNQNQANPTASGGDRQWDSPPPMTIDVNKKYFATVKMATGGEFVIQLLPDKAPKTVNNFVFLARQGYYDGVTFHRVLDGFMAQGGDPTGTGMGGPGYEFENEDSNLTFDEAGVVAMANAGRDTNGSQFFITFAPVPRLNGGYTIFGKVTSGMDVVNAIKRRDPDQNPTFTGDAIESIAISEE